MRNVFLKSFILSQRVVAVTSNYRYIIHVIDVTKPTYIIDKSYPFSVFNSLTREHISQRQYTLYIMHFIVYMHSAGRSNRSKRMKSFIA